VLLMTVKTSPLRLHLLEAQRDFNRRLGAMAAARRRVHVVDVASPLLNSLGEPDPRFFASDRLHLNADGYETWLKPVMTAIEDRLKH
jgi:lysophospholipase L1-like esterase